MAIEYIKRRILTEKTSYQNLNKYIFEIENFVTKPQIKQCISNLFNLNPNNIISINTHRPPQKRRGSGGNIGKKTTFKRAIITLKKGETLAFGE